VTIQTFHALVLKSHDSGETSGVVQVLTAAHGRLSLYARGLRSPKNSTRAILQPLSLVEVTVHLPDGADIATLREASLVEAHPDLLNDLERLTLGLLLTEAAAGFCEVGQECEEQFAAAVAGLADLSPQTGKAAVQAAACGLLRILNLGGYGPQLRPEFLRPWPKDTPRPTQWWLDAESGLIGTTPAGLPMNRAALTPGAVRFLYERGEGELPPKDAEALLGALIRMIEVHQESPLRSAAFWREMIG